jgi:uncharacterized membrane protein YphA (DoxX/SURF4 family)
MPVAGNTPQRPLRILKPAGFWFPSCQLFPSQRKDAKASGAVTVMHEVRSTNKDHGSTILLAFSSVFLRFALGFSFLSAVADRFGFWGSFGQHHVAWGTFARFVAYTGQLNWFLPKGTVTTLAIVSTCAETNLGVLLLLGWQTRTAALLSGVLLLLFAVTMTGALGIKAPLDFSVFSASGGALVLASCTEYPFSIDRL